MAKAKTCLPDNVASPGAVAAMRFLGMARVDFRCVTGKCFVAALDDMSYAGAHWLPTFAIYWLAGAAAAPPR